MAMTRKPDSKAEVAADRKKGIKPGSAADKKQDKAFGGKRAPAFGTKGGRKPKKAAKSGAVNFGY